MQNERLEFFKLDPIDRKVLFWLMDNVDCRSVKGWIEYIATEYQERNILIDATKLYAETRDTEDTINQ